jgi:hypothetical protein
MKKIDPNSNVSLKFNFQLGIFHMENIPSLNDAFKKLAEKYNLHGNIRCVGRYFYFDLKGKNKDADAFYYKIKELIR